MSLLKIKSRKYKKYRKKIIKIIVYFICLAMVLIFLSHKLVSLKIFESKLPNYIPSQDVKVDKSMEGMVYFNNEFQTTTFSDIIISSIENAQQSIEVAMYSFNLETIRDKIYEANQRGAQITLILDIDKSKQHDIVFADLPKNIERIDPGKSSTKSNPNMHHKFVIIDRGTPQQKLITGSLNWTTLQESFDPSFLFVTTDSKIIQAYGFEFDLLKQNISGTKKLRNKEYKPWLRNIIYNDCFLDVWFSPGFQNNSINQKIVDLIENAQENIEIIIWQATDKNISRAIVKKARKGLSIKIITEDFNFWEQNSIFPYLMSQKDKYHLDNLEIINDVWRTIDLKDKIPEEFGETFNSFIHHHTLIIDDKIVIFGTNNWSNQAAFKNDEDIIITDNKNIVNEFRKTFAFHYQELRNKELSAQIIGQNLEIKETPVVNKTPVVSRIKTSVVKEEQSDGETSDVDINILVIPSKYRALKEKLFICIDQQINENENTFLLPEECLNVPLNIFIYDQNNNLIANNLIMP